MGKKLQIIDKIIFPGASYIENEIKKEKPHPEWHETLYSFSPLIPALTATATIIIGGIVDPKNFSNYSAVAMAQTAYGILRGFRVGKTMYDYEKKFSEQLL